MLYQVYETQRTLMEPFVDFAQAAAKLYGNPQSPMAQNPFAQRVAAGYSLIYRLGKDYEKPAFEINAVDVDGTSVAIHERIEIDKPFCELRRFKRFTDDPATLTQLKSQPAVLIVAPLSGHYATLLRDTVKAMLKDHKVYITDWKNARIVPLSEGEFHLDDYVNYVQEFIGHLQSKYGNCHVISVCQPTVPVFAAISLMAARGETTPLTMTMMGGPIDARLSPTSVNNLATTKPYEWFENNVIYKVPSSFPGAGRRVYPGFLQHTGFVAMNPDRHATSHFDYFKDLLKGDDASAEAHRKFYDEYNAVLDMDANYYLDTIKTVFQEFKLVNGTWDVRSIKGKAERVTPSAIKTTAVMTVEGELDDISGSGQTKAALAMCTGVPEGQKRHLEVPGAGHYGIFSGRRWRDIVYPALKAFILESHKASSSAQIKPPTAKKPVVKALAAATKPVAKANPTPVAKVVSQPTTPKPGTRKPVAIPITALLAPKAEAANKIAVKAPVTAGKAIKPAKAASPAAKPANKPTVKTMIPVAEVTKPTVVAAAKPPAKPSPKPTPKSSAKLSVVNAANPIVVAPAIVLHKPAAAAAATPVAKAEAGTTVALPQAANPTVDAVKTDKKIVGE